MPPPGDERELLLVVEDDPGVGDLELRELTRRGYRVRLLTSAEEALAAADRYQADCWLIDQMLSAGHTGLELVAELRQQGVFAPVVLVTGFQDPDIVLQALRAGVGDFVHKGDGFLELLVSRVEAVLAAARVQRELQLSRARADLEYVRRQELESEIAERRRAESQAHAALARLREADRRKDEFLAMLGHELRNPLAPIASAVEVLRGGGLGQQDVATAAAIIGRQVDQLRRLVDDLLDVARIMNGRMQLQRARVDLREVALRAVERARPALSQRQQRFEQRLPEQPVFVDGDAVRLTQVVANLLDNASKYTPIGGDVRLELEAHGDVAELAVVDAGVGIAPEEIEALFGLFVQGSRAIDRAEGGLGLGLSLVRRIASMHGGEAGASSAGLGHGSRFHVRLPLLHAPQADAVHQPQAPDSTRAGERTVRRALVVDDNVDAATATAMLLRLWGFVVRTAHDGESALAVLREFDPEAVLLDLGLPKRDGYEVLEVARREAPGAARIWIAVTGYGQEVDRARTRAAGFAAHLVKPVEVQSLRRALLPTTEDAAGSFADDGVE